MAISTIGQNGLQQSQIISAVNMPTGSVIQVVSTVYQTSTTTTSASTWTNSGCTCSITPQFSTSKILISAQLSCYAEQAGTFVPNLGFGMRLLRSGTPIWQSSAIAAYFYTASLTTTDSQICQTIPITYLDSPNTTSSITYSTQGIINIVSGSATFVMQYGNSPAVITLQEIR